MKVLVTGVAGFIGMHVCQRLLARGDEIIGIDNLNDYYDVSLKEARLDQLQQHPGFRFARIDIADRVEVAKLFEQEKPQCVVHLAAQAGVRYSITNPHAYADSNLIGFVNILEGCRHANVQHLVYASSSSVYGGNTKTPFSESDRVDQPVSLYAATKKANELMAHAYSHLYGIPATGLRFFTVYGPWGRPDMAYFSFTQAILEGRSIDVFNHGQLQRDFTYIDDITEGVVRVLDKPATLDAGVPHRVFNIGNHEPVALLVFIETLEKALGRVAIKNFLPMQPGDVHATHADTIQLQEWVGFSPDTPLQKGIEKFVAWYHSRYEPANLNQGAG
ncbi:MAG TPA: NAD-dependent epimerase [Thiotrichales bacterium]|uniref:NAD-dependent epimerase n=1 Tax=Polynucleobacter sp. 35-46-11 TaxID=1970425 RepID=UPI000BC8F894|nr:NAD-dependent epimerase [Polynucleobacter sp. 35-46-11]OYY11584.1 MAG: protein CapI [Polynucleobacter sp. 35-46-11]HQR82560.1 NAD-dependent epimerase [Thiotrichales bacterium]HQS43679.1 NAD-dependent epimerase [Methylotenera sp.]